MESLDWKVDRKQIEAYRIAAPEKKDEIVAAGYRRNIDAWLTAHAQQIVAAHATATGRVCEKYEWLASYHNSAAKQYTENPSCLCSLK